MTDSLPPVTMTGTLCSILRPQFLSKLLLLAVESQLGTGNFTNNDTWVLAVVSHSYQGSGWLFLGPQERIPDPTLMQ